MSCPKPMNRSFSEFGNTPRITERVMGQADELLSYRRDAADKPFHGDGVS